MSLPPAPPIAPPPGLSRMRGLARAVLAFERVWPAVAPALGVLGVALCAALLDLPGLLTPTLHLAALAVTGVAILAALAIGLRRVVLPRAAEADRRLEADSGLRHQPLAVLEDRPAGAPSPLWAAHVARARAQVGALRLSLPRPMLAAADRHALRALVLVALAICLGIAGPDAKLRLARAMRPAFPPPVVAPAPLLQAWITPPAYTGLAPIFLKPGGEALVVPSGSRLQASLSGGSALAGEPSLTLGGKATAFAVLDAGSYQLDTELAASGPSTQTRLAITRRGREVAGWDVTLVGNGAPVLRFPERPGIQRGTVPLVRLPWEASHAYGVASVRAELKLSDRPEAPPVVLPIPLPGSSAGTAPKSAHGVRQQDLTAHPWAGLGVIVQLAGRDIAGLEGRSETATMNLPERRFTNPVARAIIELRKSLSRDPTARVPVIADLDRLSRLPEVWDGNTGGYLNLRGIASLLGIEARPQAVDEAQARMWQLALALEEGAAERAERELEQARQALSDALEAEKRGDPVDRAELDRKTRELQEALRKTLDALAEQARRDPTAETYDPEAHPLDTRDMEKLAQEMRDAAKQGDTKTEREKLAELEKMMEALKAARPEHGQMTEQERKRAEKRQRGQQQTTAVQDMVKREGDVLDHAQARDQSRAGASGDELAQRRDDQRRQQALRRALGGLMQDYGDLTGDVPQSLSDADGAMRDSAQALAEGRESQAAQAAQRAIEALQKGEQAMSQQLARQFGRQPGPGDQFGDEGQDGQDGQDGPDGQGLGQGDQLGGDRPGDTPGLTPNRQGHGRQRSTRRGDVRDPLGRTHGENVGGRQEGDDVEVPDKMEAARTRELQDELRRRGADRTRQQLELDYIDRLLKQF